MRRAENVAENQFDGINRVNELHSIDIRRDGGAQLDGFLSARRKKLLFNLISSSFELRIKH